jgi:hypothetical protein
MKVRKEPVQVQLRRGKIIALGRLIRRDEVEDQLGVLLRAGLREDPREVTENIGLGGHLACPAGKLHETASCLVKREGGNLFRFPDGDARRKACDECVQDRRGCIEEVGHLPLCTAQDYADEIPVKGPVGVGEGNRPAEHLLWRGVEAPAGGKFHGLSPGLRAGLGRRACFTAEAPAEGGNGGAVTLTRTYRF